ncbi:DUF6779 domain-containing protein [Rhodococcus sp. NPDC003348]
MTLSGRAGSMRRNKRSASQMIVAGLVVLAVVASLFLIFSDSVQVLRIGLMAALWAAVIGAIAMTRYRRESAADKAKIRDLQTVYELQLEREISARREYEAGVEARVRSEVNVDVSEIAALRVELAALRGSLEVLFDGRLPADRVAIEAEGSRMGQLSAAREGVRPPVPFAPNPAYADPGSGPTFATPFDEPVTAEVSVVGEEDEPTDAGQPPRVAAPQSLQPQPAQPQPAKPQPQPQPHSRSAESGPRKPVPAQAATPTPPKTSTDAPSTGAPRIDTSVAEVPATDAPAGPTPEDELAPPSRRSRRRSTEDEVGPGDVAGAHSSGLTVAEIMANMQAASPDSEGPRAGRRRRE